MISIDVKLLSQKNNTKTKFYERPFIKVSVPISIVSSLLILIFFIVSIVMEKPSLGDYDPLLLVTMFLEFIYLISYGIIGLKVNWSNRSSITIMLGFSLLGGFLLIIPCTISLIRFHSYVLSNCILAFGLVASLMAALLYLRFFFYDSKKRNSKTHKKSKQKSTGTKPVMKKYQSGSKENKSMCNYSLIDTNSIISDPKQRLEIDSTEAQKMSISNSSKHEAKENPRKNSKEEGNVSAMSLISKGEIEESIIKELPAMHNPEIMKHMKVGEGQKVVWNKTHFIIGLESGGNS